MCWSVCWSAGVLGHSGKCLVSGHSAPTILERDGISHGSVVVLFRRTILGESRVNLSTCQTLEDRLGRLFESVPEQSSGKASSFSVGGTSHLRDVVGSDFSASTLARGVTREQMR